MFFSSWTAVWRVLVAGDSACAAEAQALVPEIETVAVKHGIPRGSATQLSAEENKLFNAAAVHLHPTRARELIRAAAERALRRRHEIPIFRLEPPYELVHVQRPADGQPGKVARVRADNLLEVFRAPRHYVVPGESVPAPAAAGS